MRISTRTSAQIAILLQFAALIRCLAEYFRLRWALGTAVTLALVQPFIVGGLVAAIGALIAVLFYFAEKYVIAAATGAFTIAVLVVLRFVLF
jgi:uncharacterized membrane protein